VHSYFGVSRAVVIAWSVPVLVVFALIKHVSQLAYVALAASVMNLCGLVIVYATDLSLMSSSTPSDGDSSDDSSLLELNWVGTLAYAPFFFGVATYCFSGIGMVLPLENAMRHKSHFRGILVGVVVLVGFIYASFGICGYLAFGAGTQDVLLLNLRGLTPLASAVDLLFCASVFFGYPIMLFPVFDAVQHKVVPESHDGRTDCSREVGLPNTRAIYHTTLTPS
jgi:proton-coupled amino acid transporter